MYGMKEGSEKVFGSGYNVLPIFKQRLNAKTLITTPNSDVIYALGYVDLKETGPLVIEVPPGLTRIYPLGKKESAKMPAITWWPAPTGKVRLRRVSKKCSIPPRSSRWPAIAHNSLAQRTCLMWSKCNPATKSSHSPHS
jgi:Protein of unknown function (DUF1254)